MLYAIYCLDRSDGLQTRLDNYEAHRTYLGSTPVNIVLAGPVAAADARDALAVVPRAGDRARAVRPVPVAAVELVAARAVGEVVAVAVVDEAVVVVVDLVAA